MKNIFTVVLCLCVFNLVAEVIPYEPGTVIVSRESLRDWQTKALTKKSSSVHRGHGISLRHYAKDGKGKFILSKNFGNINCDGFDRLIYEPLVANYEDKPKLLMEGTLETDAGTLKSLPPKSFEANGKKYYSPCVVFDVSKAKVIKNIRLEITLIKKGVADGMFWTGMFMLRNMAEHELYLKHYRRFAQLKWKGLLKPESYKPQFKLKYELLFSNADLEKYRKLYADNISPRNVAAIVAPENAISKNLGSNYRISDNAEYYLKYCKTPYRWFLRSGESYAFQAVVKKDKELMRMAARYLLSIATVDAWNDDPRKDTVGQWRWPAFTPSANLVALATGLDFAGEMLTVQGVNYILKAMVLKGIGPITYSLWDRNYAFNMNQGIMFLKGKIIALSLMDRVWPRVTPMLENSKRESDECMSRLFKSDGSYMETVAYLNYTIEQAVEVYLAYSMYAKKPLSGVMPQCMKNFGNYAEVISSTSEDYSQVLIPLGQCHNWNNFLIGNSAFLAVGCPGSMWVNLYKKISAGEKKEFFRSKAGYVRALTTMRLCELADKAPILKTPKNFILLKGSGLTSSLREIKGQKVKIVVVGDAAGVGKKAYDTSSFVLEFAGSSFAAQMPVDGGIYYESQYRNMTVPVLKNGLYANQKYLLGDAPQSAKQLARNRQCPVASGDAKSFKCTVDASLSWDKAYFKNYARNIDSPTPDEINITDEYELGPEALGAAFMWITYLPVEIKGNKAIITGRHAGAKAVLTASDGCVLTVEKFCPDEKHRQCVPTLGMNMAHDAQLNRLIISKPGKSGQKDKITVNIKLTSL